MADNSDLEHLPKAPNHIAGESIDRDESGRYDIKVSNASGYLCHIHLEVHTYTPGLVKTTCPIFQHFHTRQGDVC